jgi:hypothetical protein
MSTTTKNKPSQADWQQLLLDWTNSGLSQRAFCRKAGIKFHTFTYRRMQHLKKTRESVAVLAPVSVVSNAISERSSGVNTETTSQTFALKLPTGAILQIPSRYDERSLSALLRLLEVLPC